MIGNRLLRMFIREDPPSPDEAILRAEVARNGVGTLVAVPLADRPGGASPAALESGPGADPDSGLGYELLLYGNEQWRFRVGKGWEHVRVQPRLRADNGEMLRAAAVAGLGICILPSFIAATETSGLIIE